MSSKAIRPTSPTTSSWAFSTKKGAAASWPTSLPNSPPRSRPEEVAKHVHDGDWNEYVITADHAHITLAINGFTTVDYTETSDKGATEGIIALQLHAGPPMQVEFKDIEIAELP